VKEKSETPFSLTENREVKTSRIRIAVEKKWGCRVEGTLNLPKVFTDCFIDAWYIVI
jgi:hypothetical protein